MFFFCGYLLGTRFLFELALPNKLPLNLIIVLGLIFLIVLISFWMYLIPVGIKYKIERFILSIWDARIFNKLLNFALIIFYFAGVLFWTVLFFSIAYGFLILGQLVY